MTSDNLVRIGMFKCSLIPRMRVFSEKTKQYETKKSQRILKVKIGQKTLNPWNGVGNGGGIWSGIRLFFFLDLVRGVHAHTSVEVARRVRQTRTAASPFQSRAWSVAFLAGFARRIKKKERLLVVQVKLFPANFH